MNIALIIGWIASVLSTISFLPQVIKTWKTKHTKDLSLGMCIILFFAALSWATYGVLIKSVPIVAANTVLFTLVSIILVFKLKYG